MVETLAIIPARGGSKGIPRKNVLPLAGQPLIAWTIQAAQAARTVDRVVVSTDDAEIADVARRLSAQVVWRPAEISGDAASSESALLHVLEHLRATENYQPQLVVFLQCTSPLTAPQDIDGTVQALLDQQADSALAVTPFHYFLWKPQAGDNSASGADWIGINHDKSVRPLRQQRDPQYLETGAVYVMRTEGFLKARHRFFGKTAAYIQPAERRWEIDDPVDLPIAEMLLRTQQSRSLVDRLPARLEALALDFDGVFTDNRVLVQEDGREAVLCSRSDGWGLDGLRRRGLPIVVISTEQNPVVAARCRKLGIECLHGLGDKAAALRQWLATHGCQAGNVIFVGNDVNDLGCFQAVGCPVAVADCHPAVRGAVRITLQSKGGQGALRELAELIQRKYFADTAGGKADADVQAD